MNELLEKLNEEKACKDKNMIEKKSNKKESEIHLRMACSKCVIERKERCNS